MPPMKNKNKLSRGKTPAVTLVDGLSPTEMSTEHLLEHIVRLREELDREREERNHFQLERDKFHTSMEITKRHLEERTAVLRNKGRELEEAEERHQVEIKVYKLKVMQLLKERQSSMEGVDSTNLTQQEQADAQNQRNEGIRTLKVDSKEQELSNEKLVKGLKLKLDEEITKTRNDFSKQVREVKAKYERKMQALRREQDLRKTTEIQEVEARKNGQIDTLMKNHEKAFSDIKNYYSDIALNNLALLNSLREHVEEMKRKEERLEKGTAEVLQENRCLTEALRGAKEELAELHKQLANQERFQASLVEAKAGLKVRDGEMKELRWEHEVLEQRFSKVQAERDELYKRFTQAIQEVRLKTGFKNQLLEGKLGALTDSLEKKEAQLNEALSATNLDHTATGILTRKLEEVLDDKNIAIKDLRSELARVRKAHNDLLRNYEVKLRASTVPGPTGSQARESNAAGPTLRQSPPGLVSPPT